MKCGACGYEKKYAVYHEEEVIRYKSGKRKGQIKETKLKTIEPFKNDPQFVKLSLRGDLEIYTRKAFGEKREIDLYACPECHTVQVDCI